MTVYIEHTPDNDRRGDWTVYVGNSPVSHHVKKSAAKREAKTEARNRKMAVKAQRKRDGRWTKLVDYRRNN